MVGPGIFKCRGIFLGYVVEAYLGDMPQGQVSLFAQGLIKQRLFVKDFILNYVFPLDPLKQQFYFRI